LTGVGPSRFTPNQQAIGVDFSRIPERLELILSPAYAGVFAFIGVATVLGVYIASLASSHTLVLLRQWNNVPDKDINRFKKRYRVSVSVLAGIAGLVAYFAL